jgi:hypothetical protein
MKRAFATLLVTPLILGACTREITPTPPTVASAEETPEILTINPNLLCELAGDFIVVNPEWSCIWEEGVPLCSPKPVDVCVPKVPIPQMPKGSGSALSQLELVTVAFEGEEQYLAFGSPPTPTATVADEFGDFIVQSQWLQTVTAGYTPSPFPAKHLAKITLPAYTSSTWDLPTFIQQAISNGSLPNPGTSGVLYQVYAPSAACAGQSSYHQAVPLTGGQVVLASQICGNYAFLPGAAGPSHEIIETITDPFSYIGKTGYTFNGISPWALEGEVGDACESITATTESGWSLANVWSNKAAAAGGSPCVPIPASYANVSPSGPFPYGSSQFSASSWNTAPMIVPAGGSVTIALTGWNSPATSTPWYIQAQVLPVNSQFTPTTSLGGGVAGPGGTVQISDGATVTLTLGVPAGTASGRIASLLVASQGQGGTWPLQVQAK